MVIRANDKYNQSPPRSKTGWTRTDNRDLGWWVGYVQRKDDVYFFATRLIKPRAEVNPNFGNSRKD